MTFIIVKNLLNLYQYIFWRKGGIIYVPSFSRRLAQINKSKSSFHNILARGFHFRDVEAQMNSISEEEKAIAWVILAKFLDWDILAKRRD